MNTYDFQFHYNGVGEPDPLEMLALRRLFRHMHETGQLASVIFGPVPPAHPRIRCEVAGGADGLEAVDYHIRRSCQGAYLNRIWEYKGFSSVSDPQPQVEAPAAKAHCAACAATESIRQQQAFPWAPIPESFKGAKPKAERKRARATPVDGLIEQLQLAIEDMVRAEAPAPRHRSIAYVADREGNLVRRGDYVLTWTDGMWRTKVYGHVVDIRHDTKTDTREVLIQCQDNISRVRKSNSVILKRRAKGAWPKATPKRVVTVERLQGSAGQYYVIHNATIGGEEAAHAILQDLARLVPVPCGGMALTPWAGFPGGSKSPQIHFWIGRPQDWVLETEAFLLKALANITGAEVRMLSEPLKQDGARG